MDVRWSCLALDTAPHFGWVGLNLDTHEHSDADVKQWEKNGPDWYHEDQWGRCCSNCADFAFDHVVEADFSHWSDWYEALEVDEDPTIVDVSGRDRLISFSTNGDHAFGVPVFEMLLQAMQEERRTLFQKAGKFDKLVRFGVQLCDSDKEWFERVLFD